MIKQNHIDKTKKFVILSLTNILQKRKLKNGKIR